MEIDLLRLIVVIVLSYLLGSLPTAYIIARVKNINIFEVGSGNMGGTNVVRALGMRWGLLTSFIDICKGISAIFLARLIMDDAKGAATTVSAVVVIVGHNWSLFATLLTARIDRGTLRATIRGGKGAATAFGTLLMIAPAQIVVVMVALGGLIVAVTRYVSLGVLAAFALAIGWLLVLASMEQMPAWTAIYSVALGLLLVLRFRDNIQRLLSGTERRLGDA